MDRIRRFVRENPWAGWTLSLIILGIAATIIVRQNSSSGRYTPDRMQEYVTIKYMDTGDEDRIPRGRVDKMLREQQLGMVDPTKGLLNPKTGQYTGFPYDKDDWEAWVKRINDDREQFAGDKNPPVRSQPGRNPPTPPPAPSAPKSPT